MKKLSNKPSVLINQALADLKKIEKNRNYVIDMQVWHAPKTKKEKCQVCLAGAVMSCRLDVRPSQHKHLMDYEDTELAPKLRALDDFRKGKIDTALSELGHDVPLGMPSWVIAPDYDYEGPEDFKKYLANLAKELKSHGL